MVQLAEFRNRELVAVLKELLLLAESNHALGLAFVVKLGPGIHHAGVTGDYLRFPEEAMAATFRLERQLMSGHEPHR